MNNNSISKDELSIITEMTNCQPEFNDQFPSCVVFQKVGLPEGWSKRKCSVMLNKDEDIWTAYVDSDLQPDKPEYNGLLSPYAREGWCEVVIDEKQFVKPEDLVDHLKKNLKFEFKKEISEQNSVSDELGVIGEVISYQKDNQFNFMYEYHGSSTIVTQEIYNSEGKLLRNLEVVEVPEGWHSQKWDGKDNAGKNVPQGIYFIKFRSAQEVGEVMKVVFIHKNFEG